MERLKQLYNAYNCDITDEGVAIAVRKIVDSDFAKLDNPEVWKKCISLIDLTSLNADDTIAHISDLTNRVNTFAKDHKGLKNVAAICVYPAMIECVKTLLKAKSVGIASVCAGFPASQTFNEVKIAEVAMAVAAGATEIDVVISLGKYLDGNHSEVFDELNEIHDAARGVKLKVILESGLMPSQRDIKQAALLSMAAGADFIKTSTGKTSKSATPEAVYTMCKAIKEFYDKTGIRVGIKPSGGIRTTKQAVEYYAIVNSVLGREWLTPELFRFGATSLLDDLLSKLENA